MRRKVSLVDGQAAIKNYQAGLQGSADTATAVRFLLEELGSKHPGRSVEVRVPPLGAVQCVEGPSHSRGTPSNVVEMSPESWLKLALGVASFEELHNLGEISASGNRSDLTDLFPIFNP